MLFLLYINDIQDNISSRIRLFADDSIVYWEIHSDLDHTIFQQDLLTLAERSNWLMDFNVKKRAILCITRKRSPSLFQYSILGQSLSVDHHGYLGVQAYLMTSDGTIIVTKPPTKLTEPLVFRTLGPCTKEVKKRAYETLVRPHLEYAAEVWNPHTIGLTGVDSLKQVQRAAARFIYADYHRTTHAV